MLTENAKLVIDFIEECRIQMTLKDELFKKQEEMYKRFYKLEDFLKGNKEGEKIFSELGEFISETLSLTKDVYFEYGENFSEINNSKMLRKYKEAV